MKSLRLNKELRQTILENFVSKWEGSNPEPTSELLSRKELLQALAKEISEKVYGKFWETLKDIPDEFLYKSSSVLVQWPDESIDRLYFGRDSENDDIRMLSTRESKVEYVISKTDKLYKSYKDNVELLKQFENELSEYKTKRNNFSRQVSQVLSSVNTTGQLIEVWPESEAFIPVDIHNPSTISLPSVSFQDLNSQL